MGTLGGKVNHCSQAAAVGSDPILSKDVPTYPPIQPTPMPYAPFLLESRSFDRHPLPPPQETMPKETKNTPARSRRAKPKVTMMDQFNQAKREQPDALLFFRMGDFYELFGEDAKIAARELGIALTSRTKGRDALAMAGVPVKSMNGHLMRLVAKGHKVAICEQMSDPRTTKGIVDRGIVRVVTAGTITEEDALDSRASNWLASLSVHEQRAGLAWVDVSTGQFKVAEVSVDEIEDQCARIEPAELLWSGELAQSEAPFVSILQSQFGRRLSERDPWRFETDSCLRILKEHFKVATLEGFGIEDGSPAINAAGALLEYLQETQRGACDHILALTCEHPGAHLILDRATRSTLELVVTQRGARREGTLIDTLDHSLTPMGGRLLREWMLVPLRTPESILYRQRGVGELVDSPFLREDLRGILSDVLDIERLAAKVATGRANARDLLGLATSLAVVQPLLAKLDKVYSKVLGDLCASLDPIEDQVTPILASLVDSPPTTIKDGGLIRDGVDSELDELRQIAGDGKAWMARFQAEEIERTGMVGLKVGFNSVFGYYLEVPRGQIDRVPEAYIRKQTLKNAERYITPELKEFEEKVLQAEERSKDMECDMFLELRENMAREVPRILATAQSIAVTDVIAALAQVAAQNRYCAPVIDNGERIKIVEGRHPVIEHTLTDEPFVPNDTRLNRTDRMVGLITGPNMSGKSTYIRQTALIVLMAQMGSYVPAAEAAIGVVDRIFTRIGSADDLSRGASTFMVEMVEIANILNNASAKSLVVLDEVGRGTSTYDGVALAWAIVEHIHDTSRARTLFATHYHQLTDLAERLEGVHNLRVAVREWQDEIIFLHRIEEGGTDRSYGIQVARLAGVPLSMISRAKQVLLELESGNAHAPVTGTLISSPESSVLEGGQTQLGLFGPKPSAIEQALEAIDPNELTPLEAIAKLSELKTLL